MTANIGTTQFIENQNWHSHIEKKSSCSYMIFQNWVIEKDFDYLKD